MLVSRFLICLSLLILTACAGMAGGGAGSGEREDPGAALEPELVLNLPVDTPLSCADNGTAEPTLLDKGIAALVAGRHVEAVTNFQRYRDAEESPAARWEAGIAIAYDSMLPASPFYDLDAATASFRRLEGQQPQAEKAHERVLMMRDSLATLALMAERISELRGDNAKLGEDLQKREEAIKRLRELTLGQ